MEKRIVYQIILVILMSLGSGLIFAQKIPRKKVIILDKSKNANDLGKNNNATKGNDKNQGYKYDYNPPSNNRGDLPSLYERYGDTEFLTMPYKLGGNYQGSKTYFIIDGEVVDVYDSHPGSRYLYNQR